MFRNIAPAVSLNGMVAPVELMLRLIVNDSLQTVSYNDVNIIVTFQNVEAQVEPENKWPVVVHFTHLPKIFILKKKTKKERARSAEHLHYLKCACSQWTAPM